MPNRRVYIRGVSQRQYSASVAKEVYAAVVARSTPALKVHLNFELFPRGKIGSVAPDACAYNLRWSAHNVVCISDWTDNSEDLQSKAKGHADTLARIVSSKEPNPWDAEELVYPNYGAWSFFIRYGMFSYISQLARAFPPMLWPREFSERITPDCSKSRRSTTQT